MVWGRWRFKSEVLFSFVYFPRIAFLFSKFESALRKGCV